MSMSPTSLSLGGRDKKEVWQRLWQWMAQPLSSLRQPPRRIRVTKW